MGDFDVYEKTYWVRLNQDPFATLPVGEHPTAEDLAKRSRFEAASQGLKENFPTSRFANSCPAHVRIEGAGIFSLWGKCTKYNKDEDGVNWSLNDIPISFGFSRAIAYQYRCPSPDTNPDEDDHKIDIAPSRTIGVFFVDWDQDGDEDVALLLEGGKYLFYRREWCDRLVC